MNDTLVLIPEFNIENAEGKDIINLVSQSNQFDSYNAQEQKPIKVLRVLVKLHGGTLWNLFKLKSKHGKIDSHDQSKVATFPLPFHYKTLKLFAQLLNSNRLNVSDIESCLNIHQIEMSKVVIVLKELQDMLMF